MKVTIEKLDHYGKGIAHLNSKIIFVENALPREIVDIKVTKEKKNILEASVYKYIKKSESRIESLCPYFNECGGCDLLHMKYEDQLAFKKEKVMEIMRKYAGISEEHVKEIIPSSNISYRNKVTLKVKDNKIGYYKKGTNEIIQIKACIIANDKINFVIKNLESLENISNIKEIVIRSMQDDVSLSVCLQKYKKDSELLKKLYTFVDKVHFYSDNKTEKVTVESNIIARLGKYSFFVSPDSFFQINNSGALKLYDKISEYLRNSYKMNVLDLYCGTGSIGIYVSEFCNYVVGIEINEMAVNDAVRNAETNKIKNIKFILGDVKHALKKIDSRIDAVILDPPRAGIDNKTCEYLLTNSFEKIIYVSCDPMTLARDLKILKTKYEVIEITPIDMFPNTHHIESVCLLEYR